MRFKNLETFYWVVHTGSFTAAAQHLFTTQPGISARIKRLEEEMGKPLLIRNKGRFKLTPAGEICWEYAQNIVKLLDNLYEQAADQEQFSGQLCIGATESVVYTWLPDLLAQLKIRFPQLTVEIQIDLSLHLQKRLLNRDYHMAFVFGEIDNPETTNVFLRERELVWIKHKDLHLPAQPSAPITLAQFPLITYTQNSYLQQLVGTWFSAENVEPNNLNRCNSVAAILQLVKHQLGIAAVPLPVAQTALEPYDLEIIDCYPQLPRTKLAAVYLKDDPHPLTKALLSLVKEIDKGLSSQMVSC